MLNFIGAPKSEETEVTLIGTGGGYGESIVIKIGIKDWIVIDSCIDPYTKRSLPLEYLEKIGVDIENDVKLILCTHWHDDHILGISQLFNIAKNSLFAMAKVNDRKKFLRFVSLDSLKITGISNSSTIEFNNCIDILNSRQKNSAFRIAIAEKLLYKTICYDNVFEIYSLSPSDLTVHEFDQEISDLITEYGEKSNKKVVVNPPNDKSVALYIKAGNERILLGADLEVSKNPLKGWLDVINNSQVVDRENKASIFKISHHGSENGYHKDMWVELVNANAISKLTPYNKSSLPEDKMLKVYNSHTQNLYITSKLSSSKAKKRDSVDSSIVKFSKEVRPSLKEIRFSMGVIRSRMNHTESIPSWKTEIFGEAYLHK